MSDSQRLQNAVLFKWQIMCQGRTYDHLGHGFAHYSTDARWLVLHFETMLYDNALILEWLTEAWLTGAWSQTQDPLFTSRIQETFAWLNRDKAAKADGFSASLNADSPIKENAKDNLAPHNLPGKEGAYYI